MRIRDQLTNPSERELVAQYRWDGQRRLSRYVGIPQEKRMSVTPMKAGASILAGGAAKLIERCGEAVAGADKILQAAKAGVRIKIQEEGGIDQAQHAAHGLAWLATTVEGLRQMHDWASRLEGEGRFGEFEQLLLIAAFGEYAAQVANGIPMSQLEIARAEALGVPKSRSSPF